MAFSAVLYRRLDARLSITSPVRPGGVASQANKAAPDCWSIETPPNDWLRNVWSMVLTKVELSLMLCTSNVLVVFPSVEIIPGGDSSTGELVMFSAMNPRGETGRYMGVLGTVLNVLTHVCARFVRKKMGTQEPATATRTARHGVSQLRRAMRIRLWNIVNAWLKGERRRPFVNCSSGGVGTGVAEREGVADDAVFSTSFSSARISSCISPKKMSSMDVPMTEYEEMPQVS